MKNNISPFLYLVGDKVTGLSLFQQITERIDQALFLSRNLLELSEQETVDQKTQQNLTALLTDVIDEISALNSAMSKRVAINPTKSNEKEC